MSWSREAKTEGSGATASYQIGFSNELPSDSGGKDRIAHHIVLFEPFRGFVKSSCYGIHSVTAQGGKASSMSSSS